MDAPAQQPSIGSELGAATGVPSVPKHADVGSVSGDGIGGAAGSSEPAQPVQAAVSKPVFKMKRTGQGSLPQTTPTRDALSRPPATPASKDTAAEPEPAMIVSDILPTQAPSTPAVDSRSELPRVSSESDSARKTKYATDEERRRATSLALKQRWASGLMDHVAKKRAETMKRRRTEALDPIGTPGITKPSGPVGSARHAHMSPAYPGRLTISSPAGLTANPTHHGRRQSLLLEQLARLFEDKPASAGPNAQAKADEGEPSIPGMSDPRTVDSRTPGAPGVSSPSRSPFSAGQAESVPGVGLNVADESEAHSEWQEEESLPDSLDDGARSGEPDGGETDAAGANSHAKDVPAQLEMAVPGRPYTKWRDSKGALLPAYGALLPEGYQMSYTTPGHPWVCPIRSCRTVFSKIAQLGYHFNRRHRGVMLHDNQDGTFSERGMYAPRSRQRGNKAAAAAPAIVVSKGGAEPGDPPAVAPRYPNLRLEDRASSGTNGANGENVTGTSATPMGHNRPEHTEAPENGVRNDGLEEVGGDTNAGDDESMEDLVDESTAGTTLQAGGAPAGITEAEPGRPYTMWPDENGMLAPLAGALLPSGYSLDYTIPGRPWICPVRTCRKAFCKRNDLGFHFARTHFAALLNDNGDGTFSIKGVYRSKSTCIARGGKILVNAPPKVVSNEPLVAGKPIPDVRFPTYLYPSRRSPQTNHHEPKPELKTLKTPATDKSSDLWAYIQPHLVQTVDVPTSLTIRHLLTLPKRRDVQFNTRRKFVETATRDIAAIIIQVTGDVAPNMCDRCLKGRGPFEGCVVMSPSANITTRLRYPCCANCAYGGKKLLCSLLTSRLEPDQLMGGALAGDGVESQSKGLPVPKQSVEGGLAGNGVEPQRKGLPGPGPRASLQVDEMEVDGEIGPAVAPAHGMSLRATRTRQLRTESPFSSGSTSRRAASSALISQGHFRTPHDLLEMEDWEVAPGRIREEAAGNADTIAFSKPYLSASQAVPVCDDVAFRVDTIAAGGVLRLEAEADKTRLCSVAAGKVRVKIGDGGGDSGAPEFVVGPHGMFKVKPGAVCAVRNGLYLDAVLHTVVLTGFT